MALPGTKKAATDVSLDELPRHLRLKSWAPTFPGERTTIAIPTQARSKASHGGGKRRRRGKKIPDPCLSSSGDESDGGGHHGPMDDYYDPASDAGEGAFARAVAERENVAKLWENNREARRTTATTACCFLRAGCCAVSGGETAGGRRRGGVQTHRKDPNNDDWALADGTGAISGGRTTPIRLLCSPFSCRSPPALLELHLDPSVEISWHLGRADARASVASAGSARESERARARERAEQKETCGRWVRLSQSHPVLRKHRLHLPTGVYHAEMIFRHVQELHVV